MIQCLLARMLFFKENKQFFISYCNAVEHQAHLCPSKQQKSMIKRSLGMPQVKAETTKILKPVYVLQSPKGPRSHSGMEIKIKSQNYSQKMKNHCY